jgi:hypothetical protein
MVQKELVDSIHEKLVKEYDEAVRAKENPRLLSLMETLIALTDTNPDGPTKPVAETPAPVVVPPKSAGPCQHKVVDIYGKCKQCGQCQHNNVRGGICLTCDQPVPAKPVPASQG